MLISNSSLIHYLSTTLLLPLGLIVSFFLGGRFLGLLIILGTLAIPVAVAIPPVLSEILPGPPSPTLAIAMDIAITRITIVHRTCK